MHSIRLEVDDSVFEKVIYFLRNLPKDEVKIVEEIKNQNDKGYETESEIKAFSNHSANLIEDWKDTKEDEIWK
jgi:hypothetical protein